MMGKVAEGVIDVIELFAELIIAVWDFFSLSVSVVMSLSRVYILAVNVERQLKH